VFLLRVGFVLWHSSLPPLAAPALALAPQKKKKKKKKKRSKQVVSPAGLTYGFTFVFGGH